MWQPYVVKRSTTWRWPLWLAMLPGLLIANYSVGATGEVNLHISGTLLIPACQIDPINIDFETIILKDLAQGSTQPKPLLVHLKNCDPEVSTAQVTIKGEAAAGNSSLLALDADSTARGVGIGFKQGQSMQDDLQLDTKSEAQTLKEGNRTLYFGAYIQKLPDASPTPGAFSATATLHIEYF